MSDVFVGIRAGEEIFVCTICEVSGDIPNDAPRFNIRVTTREKNARAHCAEHAEKVFGTPMRRWESLGCEGWIAKKRNKDFSIRYKITSTYICEFRPNDAAGAQPRRG